MITAVYSHPCGHEVAVGNGLLTTCTSDGKALSIPIDHVGMTNMANALAVAAAGAAQQASEAAGAELGLGLVQELHELRGRPQAESFRAVRRALFALCLLDRPEAATGGFAGAVVNVLEVGIAHLTAEAPEE